jgi:phosphoglycolate phosphatase
MSARLSHTFLLFDIDGTLMDCQGAGRTAFARTYSEISGAEDVMNNVVVFGRTDHWIFNEVERQLGIRMSRETFLPRYLEILDEELTAQEPHTFRGITELLEQLSKRDNVTLGICTGNTREGAHIKLRHAGLEGYFTDGGFGDHHENRSDVLREGAKALGWTPGYRLIHIGDTEHDVYAAHTVGAVAVGVATGAGTLEDLRAAGADLVLHDLDDGAYFLESLLDTSAGNTKA